MVIGAFLLPKVFTGVADAALSEAGVRGFVVLGFAAVDATGVVCANALEPVNATAPRITSSEPILQPLALTPPKVFEELNSASSDVFKASILYL
jgi:hypothetical protein